MSEQLEDVKELLIALKEDPASSKNIKMKIDEMLVILKEDKDEILKIDDMIIILENLCEDVNLSAFIRTQLWNILTLLEAKSSKLKIQ